MSSERKLGRKRRDAFDVCAEIRNDFDPTTSNSGDSEIDDSDLTFELSPVCSYCRHWIAGKRVCAAFDIIPQQIWEGANYHVDPYEGDRGIRFEFHPQSSNSVRDAWEQRRRLSQSGGSI